VSSDFPDAPGPEADIEAREVKRVRIEEEMEQSYIDYAMSVIAGRALPRVEDGLKPVHRRILYAMHEIGVTSNASHRKSSSVVGETMGDYHPHGESAIYDTLVRMAQEFSMRYPLVDGQGNFGSMDGDPAAAMRYTEARMAPIAEELLTDIEKDTVDFSANYDDRLREPDVLPAAFPNLLVNGSSGIAVGMSTNIPPHNLGEVIDATVHLLEKPECSIADLMAHVKGPDFPTGANVVGRQGVQEAYATGRGRVRVRAEFEIQEAEHRIVITELPYQQNKARLVERIAEDVTEGAIEGIRDLRDESDRDGVRIVVDLKRDAMAEVVKNQLLDSHLESTFGVINLALVDGQPRVLDLKETLEHYVSHRKEVVRRRSEHDLAAAEDRAHILDGRLTALDHVDDVVEHIRAAADRDAAKEALVGAYDLSERQAEHIVSMQLGSLTAIEREDVLEEYEAVETEIDRLEAILADESELRAVIIEELEAIKAEYADERRTEFVEATDEVTREDLVEPEDVLVVVTESDYIKRMPLDWFDPQNRGGKGIIGMSLREGDRVSKAFVANTHDYLLCFTSRGKAYQLKTYEVPQPESRNTQGRHAANLLDLADGEEITAVVNTEDFGDEEFLTMATRDGYVKRTPADAFESVRSNGLIAADLGDGDALVDVAVTDGTQDLMLATARGRAIRFAESEARSMGRTARGVHGVELEGADRVVGMVAADPDDEADLLTVTQNGYGKRTPIAAYRRQSRYGKGLADIRTPERSGPTVAVERVTGEEDLLVMSAGGQTMRIYTGDISEQGRNTQGVIVMRTEGDDEVASVETVPLDEA
jgi:DNA gyrase subunit A